MNVMATGFQDALTDFRSADGDGDGDGLGARRRSWRFMGVHAGAEGSQPMRCCAVYPFTRLEGEEALRPTKLPLYLQERQQRLAAAPRQTPYGYGGVKLAAARARSTGIGGLGQKGRPSHGR